MHEQPGPFQHQPHGSILDPVGKIPNVTNGRTVRDDVHIIHFSHRCVDLLGHSKEAGHPTRVLPQTFGTTHIRYDADSPLPTTDQIMSEFPSLFDGQIRTMPGEEFHISLTEDAHPFCVSTPHTIPFAYCDKLKKEIDLSSPP